MGLIHIYCGDGQGKTTAALGLALRASGSGMKVHIVQLLKGSPTSELISLAQISNISVARCQKDYGFTFNISDENKKQLISEHNKLLLDAVNLMDDGKTDMLIIDEFNAAYEYDLMDREIGDRIVMNKPESVELVLTGRNPAEKFIEAADYVSQINCIKHPYESGITARKGIEF